MNKVKLIKSFAGLPIGEYAIDEYNEYYIHTESNNASIHKDIVQGMKEHFEEVKERPTSREALGVVEGYWVDESSVVNVANNCSSSDIESRNIYRSEKEAEASIALAQVTQLLDKYNIPEKSNVRYKKSCIEKSRPTPRGRLLEFDTEEKCSHFYKHHADLVSKLAPFYIF